jgi:hypothetical protein
MRNIYFACELSDGAMTEVVDGYTLLLAAAAGSTAALVALRALAGDDDARLVRRIASTPRLAIADAAEARAGTLVRVVGVVRAADAALPRFASLLDGTPALAFDVDLALAVGESRTPVDRAVRAAPFVVEDGTGTLLVRAATVRLAVATTVERVLAPETLTEAQRRLVEEAHGAGSPPLPRVAIAWREGRLLPGARVALVGYIGRVAGDPVSGHAYRDRPLRAALVDAAGTPLLATDDPSAL